MKKLSAPAKLNLHLEVLGKLPNGYHELSSEVVFLDLADEISISTAENIIVEGTNFPDEIVLKAANLMSLEFGITQGAKLKIHKNIPSGAGLGGGSADAAATIILLKDFWNINCEDDDLYKIGLKLGADVPACLYYHLSGNNSVHFSGIGEVLTEGKNREQMHFVLVNPNKPLATKDVFNNFVFEEDLEPKINHLQKVSVKLLPDIADILKALKDENPALARMTGSGATCFGVFDNKENAIQAAFNIKKNNPRWWVQTADIL